MLSPSDIEAVVTHMNDDHRDAVLEYAITYAGKVNPSHAEMTSMTTDYMDLRVDEISVRIYFDRPIDSRESSRVKLVELLKLARSGNPPKLKFETLDQS